MSLYDTTTTSMKPYHRINDNLSADMWRACDILRRDNNVGGVMQYTELHLQETFSDVVKTDKTGLSKTAHTRWMISAFANFLPGSTIFRLA